MGLRVDFVGFVVLVSFSYAQNSRIPTQYLFRAIQTAFQPGKPPVHGQVLNHMVKEEPKELVKFELKNPVSATSVAVQCREDVVQVEVKQDFLGKAKDFYFIFTFQMFSMSCSNPGSGCKIVVSIRKHNVTSSALKPTWVPFASTKVAEHVSSLSDDWQFERPSSVYFLGHVMSIAASIIQAHHTTLHVYVDSCVATLAPEMASEPRYSFIENRSKSHFLQQTQDDKLQLQLEAFRFHQDERSSMYITCHLRARSASASIDSEHEACSWVSAGGDDLVCDCCDSTCGLRKGRSLPTDNVFHQSHL
uniref:Zona pellucida sperm-binding protein 3 n=1 Tax=Hucho hucho TaxID=62062 RepID=A0A4W5JCM3_9TELE